MRKMSPVRRNLLPPVSSRSSRWTWRSQFPHSGSPTKQKRSQTAGRQVPTAEPCQGGMIRSMCVCRKWESRRYKGNTVTTLLGLFKNLLFTNLSWVRIRIRLRNVYLGSGSDDSFGFLRMRIRNTAKRRRYIGRNKLLWMRGRYWWDSYLAEEHLAAVCLVNRDGRHWSQHL